MMDSHRQCSECGIYKVGGNGYFVCGKCEKQKVADQFKKKNINKNIKYPKIHYFFDSNEEGVISICKPHKAFRKTYWYEFDNYCEFKEYLLVKIEGCDILVPYFSYKEAKKYRNKLQKLITSSNRWYADRDKYGYDEGP